MLKIILFVLVIFLPLVYGLEDTNSACFYQNSSETTNNNTCFVSISVIAEKKNYNNAERIVFFNNLSTSKYPFVIQYWIEDSEGNIIKDKINTTNLNQKSFTPNFNKPKTLLVKNELVSVECNNTSKFLSSEAIVFVHVNLTAEPSVEISSFYLGSDNKTKLGDRIIPKINTYTGRFTNSSLIVEITNVTEPQYFSMPYDYENYEFKPEIIIPNDCNITTGYYDLKAVSFGIEAKKSFLIENKCKNTSDNSSINSSLQTISYQDSNNEIPLTESNINLPEIPVTGETVYSSSGVKANKPMVYAFAAVALFMLLALMPKTNILKGLMNDGVYNKGDNGSDRSS